MCLCSYCSLTRDLGYSAHAGHHPWGAVAVRHDDIWRAIDALAAENGLSASGLARKAGLDPTAFNPSKRIGGDGRARWPSTESINKVLAAVSSSWNAFAALVGGAQALPRGSGRGASSAGRRIPLIGLAQA